jgi:copper transport protein
MRRAVPLLALIALALAAPATAFAHAALLHTTPSASVVVNRAPQDVRLTYSEPVEPKFAIVSVTDANGNQETSGSPRRSSTNADELVVPLKHVPSGWYLVFWRVISVDGHPVRGAFTFAVGPSQGPPPQFAIPSLSETATTPKLLITRWIVFLSTMAALGLFLLRITIAQPLPRRVQGASLRTVTIAFWAALGVAIVAAPIYAVFTTAEFALRSSFDLNAVIPLIHQSAFGRGYLDLTVVLLLFAGAAAVALWLDRPDRPERSIASLLALGGALAIGVSALVIPGTVGHASQTSPRGVAMTLDALHLVGGSVWIGGLIGLIVLWQATPQILRVRSLSYVVPRFSKVALVSVLILLGSGIWASVLHLPTLGSLWQTSYGLAIVAKIGLLGTAMLLASVNLLRNTPRLAAAQRRPDLATGAAGLLRRLVTGEVVLVVWALFAAAILTSLAPPSKALAEVSGASARVGPGPVRRTVKKNGYNLVFAVSPNKAAIPNEFNVQITKSGRPVSGAHVIARFQMLDMDMQTLEYSIPQKQPGLFSLTKPALVMVGHWGLNFEVTPPGGKPFNVLLVDKAGG